MQMASLVLLEQLVTMVGQVQQDLQVLLAEMEQLGRVEHGVSLVPLVIRER